MVRVNSELCKRNQTLKELGFIDNNHRKSLQKIRGDCIQCIGCIARNRISVVCRQLVQIHKSSIQCWLYNQNAQPLLVIPTHQIQSIRCLPSKHRSENDLKRHCYLQLATCMWVIYTHFVERSNGSGPAIGYCCGCSGCFVYFWMLD